MKRFFIVIGISIVSQIAVAQWKYTVSLSTSGCDYLEKKMAEGQVNYWMGEGYRTFGNKNECEQSRQFVMSQSYTNGNCRVRYIASPCTGPSGTSNSVDVLRINRGSSSYSTNPVNEINDWSKDYMERMLALNKDFHSSNPTNVATGDPSFDDVRLKSDYSFQKKDFAPYIGNGLFKGIPNTPLKETNSNISSPDLDMFEPVWQMEKNSRNLHDADVFAYRNRMEIEAIEILKNILSSFGLSRQELESYIYEWRQMLNSSYLTVHSEYEKTRDLIEKSFQLAQFKIEYKTIQANKYIKDHPNEQGSTEAEVGFALARLTPLVKEYEDKYKDYDDDQFLANREKELLEKYGISQDDISAIKNEVDNESLTGKFTTLTTAVPNVGIENNNEQQKKAGDKSEQTLATKNILDKAMEGVSLAVVASDLANLYSYGIERDAMNKLLKEQDENIRKYDSFYNTQESKLNDLNHLISVSSNHSSTQHTTRKDALKVAIGIDNTLSHIRNNVSGNNYNEVLPDLAGKNHIFNREHGHIRIHL